MKTEMMKAFCYVRQSYGQSDPDDSLSLEVQENECKKFAASKGIKIIATFREANHSGRLYPSGYEQLAAIDTTYQKWCSEGKKFGQWRQQLGRLLKRLNEVECLICYDITRLHRSLRGSFLENLIIQELTSHNVKVLTLKEGEIDFKKFTDTLVTNLTSQINSEQLIIQKEKSQASLRRLKDSGEWNFSCTKSFGYRGTGRKREVEVDELRADIVRKIYEGYISGKTYWRISREINPEFFERTGKTIFKQHMLRILKNPIYCGYFRNSKGELIKAKPIEGKEIIDFATWKKAQDVLAEHKAYPKRCFKNWLPLAGRVYCGYCGEHIGALTTECGIQYRCMSYSKHGYSKEKSCKNGIMWHGPEPYCHEGDFLRHALKGLIPIYYMDKLQNAQTSSGERKQEIQIELLNLEKKISTLTQTFMEGIIEESLFKEQSKAAAKKKQELQQELDEMNSAAPSNYTKLNLLFDLNMLEDRDDEELTEIFKSLFKKLTLFRDRIDIETTKGMVTLPIEFHHHVKEVPAHTIVASEDGPEVVYYFGEFNEDEDTWKLQCEVGGVKIYLQQE